MSNWTILGSGVVGLCVATILIENGEKVTVIYDKNQTPASWFAGGMLSPWCEIEHLTSNFITLGEDSILWWKEHVSNIIHKGTLVITAARDTTELNQFARITKKYEWIFPAKIEPELEDRFSRGLFFSEEAHLDPRLTLIEMREKLNKKGVQFLNKNYKLKKNIIDCRGIHAKNKLPSLRAVRGEMIIIHTKEINFSRPIRLLHPRFPCYLVPRQNGYFMLGATMIESNDNSNISARSMMELLSAAYTIHPALVESRIIESASGLRPAYPNNLPKINYNNGIFYVNGMYRHGFLLAPIIAKQLIQFISKGIKHENHS
ncbi:FAD-dependent oxidoreductase [Pantoea sp. Mhis]|uniref:FAD-dependent oxidoreductase n=1 Tax=Pantoea sp. Mhis TaxID=2576759 RepID=UPI00135AAE40|nr:FAD-dependent oxidoreductase [Pantoea sp. Mhis]MXP56780.1 FAD-dependent oxidoreductase [Pantoea sp. Mhis]